jgi:hypothetical protein
MDSFAPGPIVSNGSQQSIVREANNCVFRCGTFYRSTRTSAMELCDIAQYRLVWATKLLLAAKGLVFPAQVLGYKSFNCSMYQVPVPTLIEKFV